MITLKIYNDDKLRRYNYLPREKDPNALEHTLEYIINNYRIANGLTPIKKFDINNPEIANMYFTYYTFNNFRCWGQLPLCYIYNDMIRSIQNKNIDNNFVFTMESISITNQPGDLMFQANKMYMIYDIVESYIVENYMSSYNYMKNNCNGIMVSYNETNYDTTAYIISVGFNPKSMCNWFSSSDNRNDTNAIPYARYRSLYTIMKTAESKYGVNFDQLNFESSELRSRENIQGCLKELDKTKLSNIKKKCKYDTETKYGNYDINYNILDTYDNCIPACTFIDGNNDVSLFNQECNYKNGSRVLNKQIDMIDIDNKRRKIDGK